MRAATPQAATQRAALESTRAAIPTLDATLDVTPTYITGTPPDTPIADLGIITPVPGDEIAGQTPPTETPTPIPQASIIIAPATRTPLPDSQANFGGSAGAGAWTFNLGGGPVTITGLSHGIVAQSSQLPVAGWLSPVLFARSPANPNHYVFTDPIGRLYTYDGNEAFRPYTYPFLEYPAETLEANRQFVRAVAWSPDGRRVAFIIDGDYYVERGGTDDDGVFYRDFFTGEHRRLVFDCPGDWHRGCFWGGERGFYYQSVGLEWSPGSTVLLISVDVTQWYDGWDSRIRKGALLVAPAWQDPSVQPTTLLYDYGSWTLDGARLVVSGMSQHGRVMIGTVNTDGSDEQILWDASAVGWWVQNAVQRPGGQIVALARQGDRFGPMQLVDQYGTPLTGAIGWSAPSRVQWSPDRSAVLATAGGRHYVAYVNGVIQDITDGVTPGSTVGWLP